MPGVELELTDIQGTVLRNRPMPYVGTYLLFRIDDGREARALVSRAVPHVTTAADWESPKENAWINIVFTHAGLARMGVAEEILAAFPREFREGMAARKEHLGDVGASDPALWDMPHGGNGFHLGILVMAATPEQRDEKLAIGHRALSGLSGVSLVSRIEVGVPPTMREHFGFADGISRPFIEGQGGTPLPGQGEPSKAGEFLFGYTNELGQIARTPGPEQFWRNGTYLSIRKLRQNVMAFRQYLRSVAETSDGQAFVAAKMMGRWQSGCPLALSPARDEPALAMDPHTNNAFGYFDDDPHGLKTPLGSHIRRVNPRDSLKDSIVDARLHRILRRGSAYGPVLPEDAVEDDGVDRGIILALINTDLARQFEFIQSQWVNDSNFISEGSRTDPIVGRRDVSSDFSYPARPIRRRLTGLADFALTRGGEHVLLPGISGLRWLASL